ncbi:hypothetical protein SAMN04488109_6406 [Chryseolinea serpens]|uniref:Uncharacterized protein n=1 Tax=Chryseolinea serpens TaxID=947013 RepID=A0A1M5XCS1_9BACT|nr:hypothetical protein [Chryseolinea serpens]SHH97657.1 hypothetical protein SAMN04488109_6406 [Chryseolinea serpens]
MIPRARTYRLVDSRIVFIITLLVIALTIVGVYLWGLGSHHTFFENSFLSTTILSAAFCSFITVGLFHGIKLKDNVGRITDKIKSEELPEMPDISPTEPVVDIDDDFGGMILGIVINILLWIVTAVLLAVVLWVFGQLLVISLLAFAAMLYWIFFRALRLVFKNSRHTKGDLPMSVIYGVFYTFLYNFWIYGLLFLVAFFKGTSKMPF